MFLFWVREPFLDLTKPSKTENSSAGWYQNNKLLCFKELHVGSEKTTQWMGENIYKICNW